jgi:capsular polysaccharide biosynthesis protein
MLHILQKNLKLILSWGVVFALISTIICLILPWQYSANTQVLFISSDRSGVDPYTQSKSAERIGENISQVMKTTDFYQKVMKNTSFTLNKDVWINLSERSQRKKWNKDVLASMAYGTSLMNIGVYSKDKKEAVNLANAVAGTLATYGWEYVGGNVTIKTVSTPLVSLIPARPNFLLNIIVGFVVGVLISGMWVIKYKKHNLFV